MTRLCITSDTHVPTRARGLPDDLWRAVDSADIVFHAGDWTELPIFEQLRDRAAHLIAVWGNNDGHALRAVMPEVARQTIDGVRFAMVHETGASTGRERRADALYPDTDVLVFGHSHIPWDSTSPAGLRLLNPGSPTDRRRQPFHTWLTANVLDGVLCDVELHRP